MCVNISCPNLENNDYCNSHLRKLFNIDIKNNLTALNTIEEAKAVDFWLQYLGYYNFQYLNEKGL